jgi:hypothetical protein
VIDILLLLIVIHLIWMVGCLLVINTIVVDCDTFDLDG